MDPRLVTDRRSKRFLPKKRLRKILRNNIDGITRPSIRRLARRGGVIRISADVYPEVRKTVKNRLTEIIRQIILVMESSTTPGHERKLVRTQDVVFALNRMGHTLYGFG
ncbi:histone-fold-containing protein [Aspergillus welwitschiae]|uniref:Histone H4 n=1 Tax=Aspergillus welwitschiae TaxID=1341132 RepID=A0A3F3Q6S2_9EURO|nr:histone-fold-containing protein [Aspergillus welwitschiae]RDH34871.1 histone-fold-containing protein [Aspergillus welwitschiae]